MSDNPYYAFIELEVNGKVIDNSGTKGSISLQAKYTVDIGTQVLIEIYDDTAHEFADYLLESSEEAPIVYVKYGYNTEHFKLLECVVTGIHTQITGLGEVLTIELLPRELNEKLLSTVEGHTQDKTYKGKPSDIVKEIVALLNWQEGIITETKEIRGENNFNDDPVNSEFAAVWYADQPVNEFFKELASSSESIDGRVGYSSYIDFEYYPPIVNFCPPEDLPEQETTLDWTYGREESEIISLDVDWGTSLFTHIGDFGSIAGSMDSGTNDEFITSQTAGHVIKAPEALSIMTDIGLSTGGLTEDKGLVIGPEGEETFYSTLDFSSKAFTYTINDNPGKNLESMSKYYRNDGVMMWGDFVVVAADISGTYKGEPGYPDLIDHKGKYNRGDIVQTSLGKGIVVDGCRAACDVDYPKFDISTNWRK